MSPKPCFVVLLTMEIFSYQVATIVTSRISKPYKIMLCDVVIMYMITEMKHIDHLHNISNIKTVDVRRKRQILTCIWRNIQNKLLKVAVPTRYTRAAEGPTLYLPIPGTELFKKSVYYYGATLWNTLPVNMRLHDNIDDFKSDLYKHIT